MGAVEVLTVTVLTMMSLGVTITVTDGKGAFNLVVLHTNDMHARFEQTNSFGGKCIMEQKSRCYGGFARVVTAVRDVKTKFEDDVLFLNAGDTFQGSVLYTIYKWRVVAHFIELLGIDVMSLGNHEFDEKVEGLLPFLQNTTVPVVAANLDATMEPTLLPYIKPSVVLNINDTLIGVIGYLTPDTKDISYLGNVVLRPEVESVAREAARLRSTGVKVLIALGHSGYSTDLEIARLVPEIDLVVGGHTNTFLYTGTQPDSEKPLDVYPKIVIQKSGRKVPVVQAYAYTKYLGYLHLSFDEDGEIINYEGNPILLDHEVTEDAHVLMELEQWQENVTTLTKEVVGHTRVFLDGSRAMCRNVECNLGNLITDAMVHYNFEQYSGKGWTDGAIAILHGGSIRSSIGEEDEAGIITLEDVMTAFPFEDPVLLVELSGKHVLEMLELSASFHDPNGLDRGGGFLQLSGLYVRYNMSKPIGKRTMEVKVRCADCHTPTLQNIDPDASYSILMASFLAEGGDRYSVIAKNRISSRVIDVTSAEMLVNYLHKKSPIAHGIEWRIQIAYANEKYMNQDDEPLESIAEPRVNSGSIHLSHFIVSISFLVLLGMLWF